MEKYAKKEVKTTLFSGDRIMYVNDLKVPTQKSYRWQIHSPKQNTKLTQKLVFLYINTKKETNENCIINY